MQEIEKKIAAYFAHGMGRVPSLRQHLGENLEGLVESVVGTREPIDTRVLGVSSSHQRSSVVMLKWEMTGIAFRVEDNELDV